MRDHKDWSLTLHHGGREWECGRCGLRVWVPEVAGGGPPGRDQLCFQEQDGVHQDCDDQIAAGVHGS